MNNGEPEIPKKVCESVENPPLYSSFSRKNWLPGFVRLQTFVKAACFRPFSQMPDTKYEELLYM